MTNKDAIYILSGLKRSLNEYCGLNNNGQKAFDMAISALQAQEAKQEVKKSGCTYKPDCPWYDGSKCNSPNDHGYHECDYDRGIFPESYEENVKNSTESSLTQKRLDTIQAQDVPDTNVGKMDGDELDEAIRHCEAMAERGNGYAHFEYICQERRQLASWLRELKRLRTEVYFLKAEKENEPVDMLGDVPCKTCKWRVATTEKCEECIDGVSDNYEVQEPCEDAVSREAAIDAALSAFTRGLLASPDIRRLPSAQPKPYWIPVSERLPDMPIRVLVQLDNGWIITAYRQDNEWFSVPAFGEAIKDKWVEAWMPLPEPYRAERRTDE